MISERLFIDAVDGSKVVHRLEEYRRLYDFSQITAGSFNDCAEVLECLFCLFIDAASYNLPSRRIKWDVSRDEQKIPKFYGLRVRANRAWGVYHRVC